MMTKQIESIIIRITTLCNEQCEHCVFDCGPQENKIMPIEMAHKIGQWIPSHVASQIMGGEFTCLKNYPDIIMALNLHGRPWIRLATNGQWITKEKLKRKFFSTINNLRSFTDKILITISNDIYHKNHYWQMALRSLSSAPFVPPVEIYPKIPTDPKIPKNIYPFGRAFTNKINTHLLHSNCCRKNLDAIMINENGFVHACPFMADKPYLNIMNIEFTKCIKKIIAKRTKQIRQGKTCFNCEIANIAENINRRK